MITPTECDIITKLGEIWNRYLELPEEHPMGRQEFCSAIHQLQDKVAARSAYREINRGSVK